MRRILVVGAGQSGLQLALGLQDKGYEVTLMSNRTADEIRTGRVMSSVRCFPGPGAAALALREPAYERETEPALAMA
ncbi:NAD-binding protein, partial [Streptomyces goshikiensis]